MRSPVVAFSLFAVAVSPVLIAAAPAPESPNPGNDIVNKTGVSASNLVSHEMKRAYDFGTAGGNAYTGATSNASGGTIINDAGSDEGVMNAGGSEYMASYTYYLRLISLCIDMAGEAGMSVSGSAAGGAGFGHGPGGNAYTGASGKTHGGDVINSGGGIDNTVDMTCE